MSSSKRENRRTVLRHQLTALKCSKDMVRAETGPLYSFTNLIRLFLTLINPLSYWYYFNCWTTMKTAVNSVKAKVGFENAQTKQLLDWVQTKIGHVRRAPTNLTSDWSDGISLCALVDAIVPGSCPNFHLLAPENGLVNIRLALSVIEQQLAIEESGIEAEKLYQGNAQRSLFNLLKKLKLESAKRHLRWALKRPVVRLAEDGGKSGDLDFSNSECFAKGMGLILAVQGRRARFNIFFKSVSELNLTVEVIGPQNSAGSKKLMSSLQSLLDSGLGMDKANTLIRSTLEEIPITCEVSSQQVSVTYIPVAGGIHLLNILWDGRHVAGSPYSVKVDESQEVPTSPDRPSPFPKFRCNNRETLTSRVLRRRILKQVILVNGEERPVPPSSGLDLFRDSEQPRERSNSVNHFKPRLAAIVDQEATNPEELLDKSTETDVETSNASYSPTKLYEAIALNQSPGEIELKFEQLANEVEAQLQDAKSISDVLSRETTPFKSFLPIAKTSVPSDDVKLSQPIEEIKDLNDYVTESVDEGHLGRSQSKQVYFDKSQNGFLDHFKKTQQFWKRLEQVNSDDVTKKPVTVRKPSKPGDLGEHGVPLSTNQSHEHIVIHQDELISPESQADSGIGPTMNHEHVIYTASNNTKVEFPSSSNIYHVDLTRQRSSVSLRRSLSFPLLLSSASFELLKPNISQVDIDDCESEAEATHNTTATSVVGFIDDEVNDCPSFVELSVPLKGSREDLLEQFPLESMRNEEKSVFSENCRASGSGLYYGQVGVVNQFMVSTGNAIASLLTVGIQGSQADDVKAITTDIISDHQHLVRYEVTRPGYYVIFVRYADCHITDSPFICKVSF
ncbi:hypothetical protein HDE_13693 [Halotydeus destructor]|nr:hypothetical protein HDE_13693 [Halotydeus destructor]